MADLLAMTVFVTVSRAALEEHWQPKVFGPSAQPLLEVCRNGETEIWRIAGTFLKAPEQAELREAIDRWRRENPQPEEVPAVRALGLASQVAKSSKSGTSSKTSVFSLLNLDPLSGLDPATREIAQARLFAERALFVSQKMPVLLRWQTELLSDNAVAQPTVQQLVTNSTQIAVSVERFAAVAEKLSGQLSTEREEIFKALEAQEKNLTPLVSDMRQTLTAGSQMSTSLNTTLTTFDALMQRFGVGETNRAPTPNTNTEPFRIRDYGQAAIQLEATARQMTELFRTFDQTLASTNLSQVSERFAPAVQQAQIHGKELVDYAFWKGLLLVAIVLAASLLYRFLVPRMCPVANPK